ncbi:MAG: amidase family protein, partial [Pseudomonadota bacterium]
MSALDDPTRATIGELSTLMRDGRLSPVDLMDAVMHRARTEDGPLSAFVHLSETARAAAERAHAEITAGDWKGPLHGVPVAIKDNHTTFDMPTGAGTSAPGVAFPLEDAHAVARLREAGAIPFAKTRMHEFAWGMETPPTRNPRDLDRVPGGSSGGSGAAVA